MSWYNVSWLYRQKITIDHTKLTADLAGYPLLITEANIKDAFWSHVKSDGSDIVVTFSDEVTKTKRELVSIDTVGKTMELYAKTNPLHTADTVMYLYYGNASASETNDADTWDSSFMMVHHMNDNPNNASITDSTVNNNDGTKIGAANPVQATGKVGKGQDYNGSTSSIDVGAGTSIGDVDIFTFECWMKRDSAGEGSAGRLYDKFDLLFSGRASPKGRLEFDAKRWDTVNGEWYTPDGSISDGVWYYVVVRYNYGSTTYDPVIKINMVDQVLVESSIPSGDVGSDLTDVMQIGDEFYSGRSFDGIIDEVRYSNILRDDNWLTATYNNESSPSTFYSVGDEETIASAVFVCIEPTGGSPGTGKIKRDGVNKRWLFQTKHAADPDYITRGYIDSSGFHDGIPV